MRSLIALACCLCLPLSSIYSGVVGTYHVNGGNSDGTTYKGTLVVKKSGEIYQSHWELSDGSSTGTGVRKGNYIAFDFIGVDSEDNPLFGVQLYEIGKGGLKRGPWTVNGEGTRGYEIAKKKK